nr:corticotropin-releasing factor receptor 2-like [Lytechinus pictus]
MPLHLIVLLSVLGSGWGQTPSTTVQGNVVHPQPTTFETHGKLGDTNGVGTSNLLSTKKFDLLVEQVMTSQGADVNDPLEICNYRHSLEPTFFNFTTDSGDRYCPSYYDEIQCWNASPPGNVTMPCPALFNGLKYENQVSRVCLKDGQWGNDNKSDYSGCRAVVDFDEPGESEFHFFRLSIISNIGYSISLCTTLGALIILITCRSLWCLRNYIHMNFLLSFIIISVVFFGILLAARNDSSFGPESWYYCPTMTIIFAATLANFCWMLVEGIYLFCTVVRGVTVAPKTLWLYALIGWVVPVILSVIHLVVLLTAMRGDHTSSEICNAKTNADYIFRGPIILIVLINVYFLIHILVVIVQRERSSSDQQHRKPLRALLVLTPLLGAAYLLFLIEPTPEKPTVATHIYRYLLTFLQSTQGFFVALFYVFLNPEVHKLIKRRFVSLREDKTLFSNVSTRNGSKPSLPNILLFANMAKTSKDSDANNSRPPIEGDRDAHEHRRNGDIPNSSPICFGRDAEEATPLEKDAREEDVNANNFHRDQRCPDADFESAPFVRHVGYEEENRSTGEGEKV